jgi:hydroxyacyl-ACP dehydratase HTD2-like protein with hotdog domain
MSGAIERTELLQPEPAHALGSLLGVPVPDLAGGEALPLLWHWVYLLDRPAQADLGLDGHPVRGSLPAPPRAGTARMWAAGRVRTHGSLRCGMPATKRTSVRSVTEKQGRSGHLTFVTMGHQIRQDGKIVVDEEQSIVYRQSAAMAKRTPGAPRPRQLPRIETSGRSTSRQRCCFVSPPSPTTRTVSTTTATTHARLRATQVCLRMARCRLSPWPRRPAPR